jgi:hypothetical protein
MNANSINTIVNFTQWISKIHNKSANFEVSFWSHRNDQNSTIDYTLWVDNTLCIKTSCIDYLVSSIPYLKQQYELNRELSA